MQITARTNGDGTILELNGKLVFGGDLIELRDAVRDATGKQPNKIILNLANVTYVDSCGIGELVSTFKHIKNQGGRLVLMNLPERVKILLDAAKLTPIFELSDGKQAAIVDPGRQVLQRRLCS